MKIYEQYFDEKGETMTNGKGYAFRVYGGDGRPYHSVLTAISLETRPNYTIETPVFGSSVQKVFGNFRRSKKRDEQTIQEAKAFLPTMLEYVRNWMKERELANK